MTLSVSLQPPEDMLSYKWPLRSNVWWWGPVECDIHTSLGSKIRQQTRVMSILPLGQKQILLTFHECSSSIFNWEQTTGNHHANESAKNQRDGTLISARIFSLSLPAGPCFFFSFWRCRVSWANAPFTIAMLIRFGGTENGMDECYNRTQLLFISSYKRVTYTLL